MWNSIVFVKNINSRLAYEHKSLSDLFCERTKCLRLDEATPPASGPDPMPAKSLQQDYTETKQSFLRNIDFLWQRLDDDFIRLMSLCCSPCCCWSLSCFPSPLPRYSCHDQAGRIRGKHRQQRRSACKGWSRCRSAARRQASLWCFSHLSQICCRK